MSKVATLKTQANNLKLALAGMGIPLTKAQALEAIAKQYGFPNFDTISGLLNKKSTPVCAPRLIDRPGDPFEMWVEGESPRSIKYDVEYFDSEALDLLHDEVALRKCMEKNAANYEEGMESVAIFLEGDGEELSLTVSQLLGLTYKGTGGWLMTDGRYLRFVYEEEDIRRSERAERAAMAEPTLAIPEMVKSAKGCALVQMPSHDGAKYDLFVIVPPHLNAETIAAKLTEEISRLKEEDKVAEETDPKYLEPTYTDTTLASFVASLGCLQIEDTVMVSENWD